MGNVNLNFELPAKIDKYLATLSRHYEKHGETRLREIVVNGIVSIFEQAESDNWNGGQYGHALTLTLSEDLYLAVMSNREEYQKRLDADLNNINSVHGEHVSAVHIEMEPTESVAWRENSGLLRSRIAPTSVPNDALNRIWRGGHVKFS